MEPQTTTTADSQTSPSFSLSDMFSDSGSAEATPSNETTATPASSTPTAPASTPAVTASPAKPPGTPAAPPAQSKDTLPLAPAKETLDQKIESAAPDAPVVPAAIPSVATMTPEQITALVKGAVESTTPKPTEPTKTKEQVLHDFNKAFSITSPTEQDIMALHQGGPEAIKVLMNREAAVMRSAVLMAKALVEDAQARISQNFEPMQAFVNGTVEKRMEIEFMEEHKDLAPFKDTLLAEVVKDTKEKVAAGMMPAFRDEKSAKDFVANRARALLKLVPGAAQPANGTTQNTTQPSTTTSRKMTTVSAGGQASSGGGATASTLPEKIFGGG